MEMVSKVTLGTGKIVLMREFKLKHQELAIKSVGKRAGDNQALLSMMVQKEIVKMLICNINDKDVSHKDLEDLDSVFTFREYQQVLKFLEMQMGGGEEEVSPNFEVVSFGSK